MTTKRAAPKILKESLAPKISRVADPPSASIHPAISETPAKEELSRLIFRADVSKGFSVKSIVDLLLGAGITRGHIVVDEKGITIRQTDGDITMLFDVSLPREKFRSYTYRSKQPSVIMSVNLNHIHMLIKTIKRRESIVLSASVPQKGDPPRLSLVIYSAADSNGSPARRETNHVVYEAIPSADYRMPELPSMDHFGNPMILMSADLQKLKRVASLGKAHVTVEQEGSAFLSFRAGDAMTGDIDVYDSNVEFGKKTDSVDLSVDLDDTGKADDVSSRVYPSASLIKLSRLSGLCSMVQWYPPTVDWCAARIGVDIVQKEFLLGRIEVCIKDMKQIQGGVLPEERPPAKSRISSKAKRNDAPDDLVPVKPRVAKANQSNVTENLLPVKADQSNVPEAEPLPTKRRVVKAKLEAKAKK